MSSFKPAQLAKIMNYDPEKLVSPVSPHARAFMGEAGARKTDFFELNPEISQFMGVTEAKKKEERRLFDVEVVKHVQVIKDDAYNVAYELGLQKGIEEAKKEAFNQAQSEIRENLDSVVSLCHKLKNLGQHFYEEHEQDLIHLSYLMAEKIVHQTIAKQPDMFVSVIKDVLKKYPSTMIQLSEKDFQFLTENRQKISSEIDLSTLQIEANKELSNGDVVFSNAVGILDGTLTSRMDMLKQVVFGEDKK